MEVMMKMLEESIIMLKHRRKRKRSGKSGKHNGRCRAMSLIYLFVLRVLFHIFSSVFCFIFFELYFLQWSLDDVFIIQFSELRNFIFQFSQL